MPALNSGTDFTANTKAVAAAVNARFDAIEAWANTTKLDSDNIQAGAITTALLDDQAVTDAKMGLTLHQDSDNGSITSTAAMPGVSLTPGAGTYFAYASVVHEAVSASGRTEASIALRVNAVNQYFSGTSRFPAAAESGVITITPISIGAVITVGAGEAVDVLGSIDSNAKLKECRLSLIRIR